MFELFEHTADLGLRLQASSLEELLVEAARGLLAMLVANPEAVQPVQTKTIAIEAEEPTYLLFDWLTELLYTFETEKFLLSQFDLQIENHQLIATCRGEFANASRHRLEHEVKAITYHQLHVEHVNDDWTAEVIVDI